MLIVVSRDMPEFYASLKSRHEAKGDMVILDRRRDDSRRARSLKKAERRAPIGAAEQALMSVLGFMVLHRPFKVERGGLTTAVRKSRPRVVFPRSGRRRRDERRSA